MMLHHIKTMLHHGELQLTGAQTEVAAALRRQHSDCPLVAHEDTIAQQAKRSNVTLTASKRLRRKTHEDVRGHNKLRPACTGRRCIPDAFANEPGSMNLSFLLALYGH